MPGTYKFRRSYKACLNCKIRKVKCDLGPLDNQNEPPCAKCRREKKECVFPESRNRKRRSVAENQDQEYNQELYSHNMSRRTSQEAPESQRYTSSNLGHPGSVFPPPANINNLLNNSERNCYENHPPPMPQRLAAKSVNQSRKLKEDSNSSSTSELNNLDFKTSQGTMVFLASAAGEIARADERDHIDALKRHQQLETSFTQTQNLQQDMHRTLGDSTSNRPADERHIMPPLESSSSVRPKPSSTLSDIDYIGPTKVLTETQARRLISLFFNTMHPFFPHIPSEMHNADILAGYPILLCAILTISARYHKLDENDDASSSNNIQVHEQLWVYCQRLISQTVWAEASTRSIGTVFAFLLFTEWNPRAIHWRWSDYANSDTGELAPLKEVVLAAEEGGSVTGLDAMRRSDRMAWMLIGSSVRLAQDMGFVEHDSGVFLATHIAEINTAMNINRRSMLTSSLHEIDILDHDSQDPSFENEPLDLVVIKEKQTRNMLNSDDGRPNSQPVTNHLKFTKMQMAKLELLQITSICYESLYGKDPKFSGLDKHQNLALLDILSPLLESWYRRYHRLLIPSSPSYLAHNNPRKQFLNQSPEFYAELALLLDRESLIFDYYYAKLYIFSLALSPEISNSTISSRKQKQMKLDDIAKSSKYVEMAFNAAKEMLSVTHRTHKLRILRFMPVRWLTRIVRAVAFVVKCYLTLTSPVPIAPREFNPSNILHDAVNSFNGRKTDDTSSNYQSAMFSVIPLDEIIAVIQRAAISLREASPDELHLCTRYSTILMYLCTQMKARNKNNGKVIDYEAEIQNAYKDAEKVRQGGLESPANDMSPYSSEGSSKQKNQYNMTQPMNSPSEQNNFEDNFSQMMNPSETVFNWFSNNDFGVGLEFVDAWTQELEQDYLQKISENPGNSTGNN
ncbi:BA75_00534T0 [Komagataella pastoris]|uniref:BA75_00534T0 n=1 Tax=Komagataella pastoris TaxID=4922 RepID=A0A1B2J996_PICPA|nr:BA75_00534T0 [Komagataella pastoris]